METSETGGCPIKHNEVNSASGCPVKEIPLSSATNNTIGSYNPLTNDLIFGHDTQPGQNVSLSTIRNVSSIPKSELTPTHQPAGVDKWVYPSGTTNKKLFCMSF